MGMPDPSRAINLEVAKNTSQVISPVWISLLTYQKENVI
jgi:hypothetical protein